MVKKHKLNYEKKISLDFHKTDKNIIKGFLSTELSINKELLMLIIKTGDYYFNNFSRALTGVPKQKCVVLNNANKKEREILKKILDNKQDMFKLTNYYIFEVYNNVVDSGNKLNTRIKNISCKPIYRPNINVNKLNDALVEVYTYCTNNKLNLDDYTHGSNILDYSDYFNFFIEEQNKKVYVKNLLTNFENYYKTTYNFYTTLLEVSEIED